MSKCSACGGARVASRKENYLYSEESGLSITLADVEVLTCPDCGARGAVVPKALELSTAIVGVLARKPGRLAGAEVTFLRSILMMSGRELSSLMGCAPSALSRWEQDKSPIGTQSDKLLRLAAVFHKQVAGYTLGDLERAASDPDQATPLRFTMTYSRGEWKPESTTKARSSAA